MNNVWVAEASNHLSDCVGFTDVGQELVTKPLTLGCAANNSGDVHERDRSGQQAFGAEDLSKSVQALVGQVHHANVWLNRCERVVSREHVVLGECVEKGRLAYVRESDDTDCESHSASLTSLEAATAQQTNVKSLRSETPRVLLSFRHPN